MEYLAASDNKTDLSMFAMTKLMAGGRDMAVLALEKYKRDACQMSTGQSMFKQVLWLMIIFNIGCYQDFLWRMILRLLFTMLQLLKSLVTVKLLQSVQRFLIGASVQVQVT